MTWWQLILLYGASYRLTRLAAFDDLTHPLRVLVTGVGDSQHHELASYIDQMIEADTDPWSFEPVNRPPISKQRFYVSRMIRCPWCIGFWISFIVAALAAAGDVTSWGWMPAVALTLSAAVGFTAKLDT